MPFKIVLFSGFALSYRRSPSYRSANQLPNRQVVLNAQGLRWTSHRNSAEYWNEQLRQSFLEGDTAKDRLESHTGLSGRGGQIIVSLRLRGTRNNSPGNQFPSRRLQTTDGPRKKENERDRPRETLISPFYPCCIFLPSLTAQTISTAECTGHKKTSAVDHDKQAASHPFVSLKTTELHE